MVNRNIDHLKDIANEVRASAFETIKKANSGHLGACSSSTELMTALYFGDVLRYNPDNPLDPARDRVYVRGHVGPLRYKIFSLLNWINESELSGYRSLGSRLKGHECMQSTPGVDLTPSGSLGMLLSYAAGSAYVTNKQGLKLKHYVFLGDGEEQEGNISEAARHIGSLGLPNVICIIDKNCKQLSRPTTDVDKTDLFKIWEGYGWQGLTISDGHSFSNIFEAYDMAVKSQKPTFIIANTQKGHLIEGSLDHFNGYHTIGALKNKDSLSIPIELGKKRADRKKLETIVQSRRNDIQTRRTVNIGDKNKYDIHITINPSNCNNLDFAQGDYFKKLGEEIKKQKMPFFFMTPDLVYKSDVQDIGFDEFGNYIDTGIREQHTVAMAHGISQTNPNARIFINYFDAFLYRASDQLNAAAQGKSKFLLLSELSGITQGKNGKTHQSSGGSAIPLFMPGVDFYEPADVQDMYNVFNYFFSNNPNLTVVRTHKATINPLERNTKDRGNIDYYPVFESDCKKPDITLVGSGFVVPNLVEAAKLLELNYSINSRVINAINLKGLENENFLRMIENDQPVLTVYNGNKEILKSLVSSAVFGTDIVRPTKIFGHGFDFGETGSIEDLIKYYSFDKESLSNIARRVVRGR